MRGSWFILGMMCAVCCGGMAQEATRPDDEYVAILAGIQQADRLAAAGDSQAAAAYTKLLVQLRAFQSRQPAWHPDVIGFRLRYLEARVPRPPEAPEEAPETRAATEPVTNAAPSELLWLRQRVQWLEQDRLVLQAKLREALQGQPAALDPAALAQAEVRLREQQQEIDRLQSELERERTGLAGREREERLSARNAELERRVKELERRTVEPPSGVAEVVPVRASPAEGALVVSVEAAKAQAAAALERGDADAAIAALLQPKPVPQTDASFQYLLGRALAGRGQAEAAIEVLQKAVALEPGHAGAHLALAELHARRLPPALTLARWHYARALEAGSSRDVGLEQRIELAGAAGAR